MFKTYGLVFTLALTLSSMVAAQSDTTDTQQTKQFRAVRVDTAPVVDGNLDEAVWQQAEVITDFHQIRPGDGSTPSEPTEVRVVYTADALYIGARMADSDPELIAAPTIRHG